MTAYKPDWRIYYSDGSTFSSLDGPIADAPKMGFICAVGYDESLNRYIQWEWGFYRYDLESLQWWGHDLFGIIDWAILNGVVVETFEGNPTYFICSDGIERDLYSLIYHLSDKYGIFQGRTLTRTEFNAIMQRAHQDSDFPQR